MLKEIVFLHTYIHTHIDRKVCTRNVALTLREFASSVAVDRIRWFRVRAAHINAKVGQVVFQRPLNFGDASQGRRARKQTLHRTL